MRARLLFVISMALLATTAVTGCAGKKAQGTKPSPYAEGNYPGHLKIGNPYEIEGRRYVPAHNPSYTEEGVASWYGPGFHGRSTANGERFDQHAMTAAHRTLPMPSMVRVTNLENGKSAVLKVNDRGPFKKDRIIDLSKGAAEYLGVVSKGTARVRVEFLPMETKELITQLVASNKLKPTPDTMALLALNDIPESAVISDADRGAAFGLVASANAAESPADAAYTARTPGVVKEASLAPVLSRDLAPPPGMGAPIIRKPVEETYTASTSVQSIPVQAPEPMSVAEPATEQAPATVQSRVQEIQIARIERAAPESVAPRSYEEGGVVPSVMPNNRSRRMTAPPVPSAAPVPPAASAPNVAPAPAVPAAPQPRELQPVPSNPGDAPLYAPEDNADGITPQAKYQISKDGVFIQAGSFSKEQNAQDLTQRLKRVGEATVKPIEIAGQTWYRVQVGPLADMQMARTALQNLHGMGLHDAHVLNKN